jgi:hypothetical protein
VRGEERPARALKQRNGPERFVDSPTIFFSKKILLTLQSLIRYINAASLTTVKKFRRRPNHNLGCGLDFSH